MKNSFAFNLRGLKASLTEMEAKAIYAANISDLWLTVRRETALLSSLLMLSHLMVYFPAKGHAQSISSPTTNVIIVNGILAKDKKTWVDTVSKIGAKFFSAHPTLASTVRFTAVYNKTDSLFPDLLQSAQQAANVPNLKPYLGDLTKFTDPNQGIFGLIGAGNYVSQYAEEVVSNRLTGPANARPQDYLDLVGTIKAALTNKQKVILIVHSQGNYYGNYAYKEIVADKAFQANLGIILPNQNLLSVVGVANPSNWSPDGRYAYVTHCNDIINLVPQHLPSNIGSGLNCVVQDVIFGPITFAQAVSLATSARTLLTYPDWPSQWGYLINHPLNFVWTSLQVLNLLNTMIYLGRLYFSVRQHSLEGNYLADGSDTQKKIYQLLEDSFSDPGCGGDANCYLKDNFDGSGYVQNWQLTDYTALGTNISYGNGEMDLAVSQLTSDPAFGGGSLTLRTRRVFSGPSNYSLRFKHISSNLLTPTGAGWGTSIISLKKASNDKTAISLTVTNDTGTSTLEPWHEISITKTDSLLSMTIDQQNWPGQSASSVAAGVMDGYYLEIKTTGNDMLQVSNLSVIRAAVVPLPPPTLTPSCSAKPSIITAGQSTIFTGKYTGGTGAVTGIWGGVVSGRHAAATYTTTAAAPAGFGRATYTVTDSGSPNKQTATANCQVQINAPVPVTPTVSNAGVVGSAVANLPFVLLVTGTNIVYSQIQAWVFDSGACNAGCRHPDSGLTNVTTTGLTLHNVLLAAGDHYLKLRNTDSGGWSNASATFTVAPSSQSVSLSLTPISTSSVLQAGSTGGLVQVSAAYANVPANSIITQTILGLPTGVSTTSPSQTVSGKGTASLSSNFTAGSNAQAGTYPLSASVTVAGMTQAVGATLQITAAPVTLSLVPVGSNFSILQPGTSGGGVTAAVTYGNIPANSLITMSLSGLPANVTSAPMSTTGSGSGTATLNTSYAVSLNALPGTYYPTATVSVAGMTRTLTATLQITSAPPPIPTMTCYISPNPLTLGQGGTVYSQPAGGTPPYQNTINGANMGTATSVLIMPSVLGTFTAPVNVVDSRGQRASSACSAQVNAPIPSVIGLLPDRTPKAFQPFNLTINGAGFVAGVTGYVCSSMAASSCFSNPITTLNSGTQVLLPNVQWNATGTVYVKVVNPGNLSSGFLNLVINN